MFIWGPYLVLFNSSSAQRSLLVGLGTRDSAGDQTQVSLVCLINLLITNTNTNKIITKKIDMWRNCFNNIFTCLHSIGEHGRILL